MYTVNPKAQTVNIESKTLNPKPYTLNPKHKPLNLKTVDQLPGAVFSWETVDAV